jgi:hypothetical protein
MSQFDVLFQVLLPPFQVALILAAGAMAAQRSVNEQAQTFMVWRMTCSVGEKVGQSAEPTVVNLPRPQKYGKEICARFPQFGRHFPAWTIFFSRGTSTLDTYSVHVIKISGRRIALVRRPRCAAAAAGLWQFNDVEEPARGPSWNRPLSV